MKYSIIFLTFFHLLIFCNITVAETTKPDGTPATQTPKQEKDIIEKIKDINDNNLYELLYKNSTKANENIIATIQWSIGLISTFVIVLLGSQIFFNYKVNKEEIRTIRSDLDKKFVNLRSEIFEVFNQNIKDNDASIAKNFNKFEKNIQDNFEIRFTEKGELLDVKIDSLSKDNEILRSNIDQEIYQLSADLRKAEGEIWKLRGVNANALRLFINIAFSRIENDINPEYILDDIKNVLQEMTQINITEYKKLEDLITVIPEKNNLIKGEIESIYNTLTKYMFIDDPDQPGESKLVYI